MSFDIRLRCESNLRFFTEKVADSFFLLIASCYSTKYNARESTLALVPHALPAYIHLPVSDSPVIYPRYNCEDNPPSRH